MQQVYELLAFVVALYFPMALLTWLVIDKFIATSDAKGQVAGHPRGQGGGGGVFSDRSRPGA
ncbi:MAG: hypothetical protein WB819_13900 [Terriglobia bacterium]